MRKFLHFLRIPKLKFGMVLQIRENFAKFGISSLAFFAEFEIFCQIPQQLPDPANNAKFDKIF